MTIIRKKDETVKIYNDYKKLNDITVTDAEPIPSADEFITLMSSLSTFSMLDIKKRYYQIHMTSESKHFTAFPILIWLYEFNYIPFGLKKFTGHVH